MSIKILTDYVQEVLNKSIVFGGDIFMYFQQVSADGKSVMVESLFVTKEHRSLPSYEKILQSIVKKFNENDNHSVLTMSCRTVDRDFQIALLSTGFIVELVDNGVCYYNYYPVESLPMEPDLGIEEGE